LRQRGNPGKWPLSCLTNKGNTSKQRRADGRQTVQQSQKNRENHAWELFASKLSQERKREQQQSTMPQCFVPQTGRKIKATKYIIF
jgi:hypothetical protein